jgi:multicomponent Na+:H+ antiporter subunit D
VNIVSYPILLPLFSAALLLVMPNRAARTLLAVASTSVTLIVSLIVFVRTQQGEVLVAQMASWPAPWGITLVADRLTGIMVLLSGLVALLTVIFLPASLDLATRPGQSATLNRLREAFGAQALLQFVLMGVNMSFLTGDLFNLFVAFEVMLIASYGLLLLGNEMPQLREGFKYVVINLLASAIFVAAAGLAYGLFGSLNMADIALRVAAHGSDSRITLVIGLLALVFATKAALFPLGFWLPNSYPTPAPVVSAFFAAILTKVGAYALIRSFTLMFPAVRVVQLVLLLLAGLTMVIGACGLIARRRWRYALAFANVASMGYLLAGVFVGSIDGLAAALFYLIHSVITIFALFIIAAIAERLAGPSYYASGHLAHYPMLGLGFFVCALALAGLPPTSGFVGKFGLIASLLAEHQGGHTLVAVLGIIASLLVLYAMVKIWQNFFWGEDDTVHGEQLPLPMRGVTAVAVALVVSLIFASGPLYGVASRTAQQLSGHQDYIQAVLTPEGE